VRVTTAILPRRTRHAGEEESYLGMNPCYGEIDSASWRYACFKKRPKNAKKMPGKIGKAKRNLLNKRGLQISLANLFTLHVL